MEPAGVIVTVRGSFTSRHAPELATVRLAVAHEGEDKADVYRRTVAAANALVAVVRPLAEAADGPATRWSSDRLHTWFERPWDQQGRQSAPVHHAQARVRVTFRDLDVFSGFLDDVGTRPGVAVEEVSWALTEVHDREYAREARRRAVADAEQRALDYAQAAGFAAVAFVAVADVGLLDEHRVGVRQSRAMALGAASMDSGPMELSPEDIVVAAEVEARFLAS